MAASRFSLDASAFSVIEFQHAVVAEVAEGLPGKSQVASQQKPYCALNRHAEADSARQLFEAQPSHFRMLIICKCDPPSPARRAEARRRREEHARRKARLDAGLPYWTEEEWENL
jgi:hypothetical protein